MITTPLLFLRLGFVAFFALVATETVFLLTPALEIVANLWPWLVGHAPFVLPVRAVSGCFNIQ